MKGIFHAGPTMAPLSQKYLTMNNQSRPDWTPRVEMDQGLTLVIDDGGKEQGQQSLPHAKAIQNGRQKAGGLEELRRSRGIGGGGDKTPIDSSHGGISTKTPQGE